MKSFCLVCPSLPYLQTFSWWIFNTSYIWCAYSLRSLLIKPYFLLESPDTRSVLDTNWLNLTSSGPWAFSWKCLFEEPHQVLLKNLRPRHIFPKYLPYGDKWSCGHKGQPHTQPLLIVISCFWQDQGLIIDWPCHWLTDSCWRRQQNVCWYWCYCWDWCWMKALASDDRLAIA